MDATEVRKLADQKRKSFNECWHEYAREHDLPAVFTAITQAAGEGRYTADYEIAGWRAALSKMEARLWFLRQELRVAHFSTNITREQTIPGKMKLTLHVTW
jgi:hypothetical protein